MRLLDLFCGAGGAGAGYARAGFDVTGVDIKPQPRYPFTFFQGDALVFLARHGADFDAIHASPPCQDHLRHGNISGQTHGTGHLLAATRAALTRLGKPWVMENVPGAPMRTDYRLCGCMFDLPGLQRERWFETSWAGFDLRPPCHGHSGRVITVAGHAGGVHRHDGGTGNGSMAEWRAAMDIDWMTGKELAQAIPPAYTQYVGERMLAEAWTAPPPRPRQVETLPML